MKKLLFCLSLYSALVRAQDNEQILRTDPLWVGLKDIVVERMVELYDLSADQGHQLDPNLGKRIIHQRTNDGMLIFSGASMVSGGVGVVKYGDGKDSWNKALGSMGLASAGGVLLFHADEVVKKERIQINEYRLKVAELNRLFAGLFACDDPGARLEIEEGLKSSILAPIPEGKGTPEAYRRKLVEASIENTYSTILTIAADKHESRKVILSRRNALMAKAKEIQSAR